MKKTLLLAVLVAMTTTACIAQKSNVRRAKTLALAETPDFNGAKAAINAALQDSTTKNLTETWYIAGLIGYQQNEAEILQLQLGKGGKDMMKRGQMVIESYDYWIVADSLSQIPTYNKKGKAKYDTKTRKMIADKMVKYYLQQEMVNYAIEKYNNNKDYKTAYEAFRRYLSIPDLPMMQEKRLQDLMIRNEDYYLCKYYMALAAYYIENYTAAMPVFESLLDNEKNGILSGEYLYQCYINLGDSAKANAVLDDCIRRFPAEPWFIQNRINNLVRTGNMNDAIEYLDHAIQNDPQVQYFISKGSILNMQKRYEEAIATYENALSIDPQNAAVYENYGFVYTDMGNLLLDQTQNLNAAEYKKAKAEIDDTFRKAQPYFEKAYELAPDNSDYKRTLRQLYYRLGETQKYEALAD